MLFSYVSIISKNLRVSSVIINFIQLSLTFTYFSTFGHVLHIEWSGQDIRISGINNPP